jgi:hypothetical protein
LLAGDFLPVTTRPADRIAVPDAGKVHTRDVAPRKAAGLGIGTIESSTSEVKDELRRPVAEPARETAKARIIRILSMPFLDDDVWKFWRCGN